jgi:hypothetical protein
MPHCVIRWTHPPDQCPTANSKIREMVVKRAPELPQLAEKLGIKFVAGPLVIGDEREGVAVVEADMIERLGILSARAAWSSGTQ